MKKLLILDLILSLWVSCKQKTMPMGTNRIKAKVRMFPGIRPYTLDGGTFKVNPLGLFLRNFAYSAKTVVLGNPSYTIEHPKGNLMWNDGLPVSLVNLSEPYVDPTGAFTIGRHTGKINTLAGWYGKRSMILLWAMKSKISMLMAIMQ